MANGWKTAFTINGSNTESTTPKQEHHFKNTIRNTKSPTIEALKAESEVAYTNKQIAEQNLLDAFEQKKVKSKTAIKKALQLQKEKAAAEKKQNEDTPVQAAVEAAEGVA